MSKGGAIAVIFGVVVFAAASGGKAAQTGGGGGGVTPYTPGPPKLTQNETRQLLYSYAYTLEQALAWYGLADFLDATAYTESRWHLRPNKNPPKPGSNAAVGPYQIRPNSGGDTQAMRDLFLEKPWLLEDPRVATACVVAYLSRLAKSAPFASWGDGRASLAFPVFIHGRPEFLIESLAKATGYKTLEQQQARYDDAIDNFAKALVAAGEPGVSSVEDGRELAESIALYSHTTRYTVAQLLPLLGVLEVGSL